MRGIQLSLLLVLKPQMNEYQLQTYANIKILLPNKQFVWLAIQILLYIFIFNKFRKYVFDKQSEFNFKTTFYIMSVSKFLDLNFKLYNYIK